MFRSIGPLEIGIIVVLVLIMFGGKFLPKAGKHLGDSIREIEKAIKGK